MEDLTNAQTGIKEACGVFGIYQFHKGNVFSLIHSGLYAPAPRAGSLWDRCF